MLILLSGDTRRCWYLRRLSVAVRSSPITVFGQLLFKDFMAKTALLHLWRTLHSESKQPQLFNPTVPSLEPHRQLHLVHKRREISKGTPQ